MTFRFATSISEYSARLEGSKGSDKASVSEGTNGTDNSRPTIFNSSLSAYTLINVNVRPVSTVKWSGGAVAAGQATLTGEVQESPHTM